MLRFALSLAALAALLVLAPLGFSAERAGPVVRVRVEGKTTTIFGATQPRARATTALEALEVASVAGEFYYRVQQTAFGPYVDQIGRYTAGGSSGWVFKVNGALPPVGADKAELKAGDSVLWYWATFTETGGPPTLRLYALGRNCYAVQQHDDAGRATNANATLRVDGKRFDAVAGRGACVGAHRGLVRATAPGAVRSNALR